MGIHARREEAKETDSDTTTMLSQIMSALDEIRARLAGSHKEAHTVAEIADITGRSAFTVRRWISEGKIAAIRVSGTGPRGRLLIPHAELRRLVSCGKGSDLPAAVMAS
jgi:excisionase family DNA binding protein